MSFREFDLDPALLAGVTDLGFSEPTPIQRDALPPALAGRDLMGAAMTGSGKTAAYVLPTLNRLLARPRSGGVRALVLAPTRELAAQVDEHVRALAVHTGLSSATVYGGVAFEPQERAFRTGVDVLIATPGRLLDHLRRPYATLDKVEVFVLDEADRMLDMGFIPDVRRILARLPRERQTMMFSATLPPQIVHLAAEMLRDPATINVERKAMPASGITQVVYAVRHELKPALLLHLLRAGEIENCLAFVRTKDRADRIASYLQANGVSVEAIHGDRTQAHRTQALAAFKKGQHRVLVATDVAARGLDLVDLTHVVNVDVPAQPEDYIHRVGRTARYENTGDAITFVAARELADMHAIERAIGAKIPRKLAEGFEYEPSRTVVARRPAAAAVNGRREEKSWVGREMPAGAEARERAAAGGGATEVAGRPVPEASRPSAQRQEPQRASEPWPAAVPAVAGQLAESVSRAIPAAVEAVPEAPVAAGGDPLLERFARLRAQRDGRRLHEVRSVGERRQAASATPVVRPPEPQVRMERAESVSTPVGPAEPAVRIERAMPAIPPPLRAPEPAVRIERALSPAAPAQVGRDQPAGRDQEPRRAAADPADLLARFAHLRARRGGGRAARHAGA